MGLFIGIDGGGSKTAGAICDEQGTVISHVKTDGLILGPAAPGEGQRRVLADIMHALCDQMRIPRSEIAACALGVNGVDYPDEHAAQLSFVSQALEIPSEKVRLVNDAVIALWGASPCERITIIQHGSGFTGSWRNQYGKEGLFDILGVGRFFDLRQELLKTVARMIDGRIPQTPLMHAALSHWEIPEPGQFAERVCRMGIDRRKIGTGPSLVYDLWLRGDPAAERLVQGAAQDYACTFAAMLRRLGPGEAEARLGGGMVRFAPQNFLRLIESYLETQGYRQKVAPPDLPAEMGALLLAASHAGQRPYALFDNLLRQKGALPNQIRAHPQKGCVGQSLSEAQEVSA